MKLTFKNTDKLQDMVRKAKAGKPKGAYGTRLNASTVACLWFVKDHGVYLMAGTEERADPPIVIYGRGYNPESEAYPGEVHEKASRACGGDDFAESVELSAEAVEAILDERVTKLVITLTQSTFKVQIFEKAIA